MVSMGQEPRRSFTGSPVQGDLRGYDQGVGWRCHRPQVQPGRVCSKLTQQLLAGFGSSQAVSRKLPSVPCHMGLFKAAACSPKQASQEGTHARRAEVTAFYHPIPQVTSHHSSHILFHRSQVSRPRPHAREEDCTGELMLGVGTTGGPFRIRVPQ